MKKALWAALIAACGTKAPPPAAPQPQPEPAAPVATTPAAPAPAAAKGPELGTYGFDTKGMDAKVAPGQDFYRYANGAWLATTQIPADKSNFGMFSVLQDRSEERTKLIITTATGPEGSNARKIADLYKSFLDEAAIEAAGLTPIKPTLDKIAAIKSAQELVAYFAASAREMRRSPFFTMVAQDEGSPENHIALLMQGGLGLPDRDMYDPKQKQFAAVRDGYKKFIVAILTKAGVPDAAKRGAAVYALEEKIAAVHWTRVQNRDSQKTYNKLTIDQLKKLAPGADWTSWLKTAGLEGQPALVVAQPPAIAGIAKLVASQPLAVWRDHATLLFLIDVADYLPADFVNLKFEMFEKTLSGTPQLRERWKRGVDQVTEALGEAVGQIYVEKYFSAETKARADKLVNNLLTAMGQRLDQLAWMSDATKAKAKAKLATYNPKIGYPKKWRDYSALKIVAGDVVGNALRTGGFEYERRLAKLGKPVDRDEWLMPPMQVNAYYNPTLNEIVFPAAILQPPFFDPNADDAVNYGAIGGVIGHEISHGFDDQGSQYDATGALKNWWTKEDADKFKTATRKLSAQYGAYCPKLASGKPAGCVNGDLTLGENIADLAGITVAYAAYKLSLGGKEAKVIDGTTGDQRFFLGWAQVWRRLYRDEEYVQRLTTDVHSHSEFRAAVVRNLDGWYDAFKVQPKDALFLAPDQRVRIW